MGLVGKPDPFHVSASGWILDQGKKGGQLPSGIELYNPPMSGLGGLMHDKALIARLLLLGYCMVHCALHYGMGYFSVLYPYWRARASLPTQPDEGRSYRITVIT